MNSNAPVLYTFKLKHKWDAAVPYKVDRAHGLSEKFSQSIARSFHKNVLFGIILFY